MKKIPREKSTITEFGAHLRPELVVDLHEKFVIETNDNWSISSESQVRDRVQPSLRLPRCRCFGPTLSVVPYL